MQRKERRNINLSVSFYYATYVAGVYIITIELICTSFANRFHLCLKIMKCKEVKYKVKIRSVSHSSFLHRYTHLLISVKLPCKGCLRSSSVAALDCFVSCLDIEMVFLANADFPPCLSFPVILSNHLSPLFPSTCPHLPCLQELAGSTSLYAIWSHSSLKV